MIGPGPDRARRPRQAGKIGRVAGYAVEHEGADAGPAPVADEAEGDGRA